MALIAISFDPVSLQPTAKFIGTLNQHARALLLSGPAQSAARSHLTYSTVLLLMHSTITYNSEYYYLRVVQYYCNAQIAQKMQWPQKRDDLIEQVQPPRRQQCLATPSLPQESVEDSLLISVATGS